MAATPIDASRDSLRGTAEGAPTGAPAGLDYHEVGLSADVCNRISDEFLPTVDWDTTNRRYVADYYWDYDWKRRITTRNDRRLPEWMHVAIVDRLEELGYPAFKCGEIMVRLNWYYDNVGISPHADAACYGEHIASLTLGAGIAIDFTRKGYPKYSQYVVPGSIFVMGGESRHDWKHGIAGRKSDVVGGVRIKRGPRVSITVRTVGSS